jgi:hypothetical protein
MFGDLFVDALTHPKIDLRRFARCTACQAFFYKPREKSRACSRKCENVLMAREHYARQTRARELSRQGKSVPEIARALNVADPKVRRYLSLSRQ